MKSLNKIYYDSFANEYTLDREVIAPPERYLTTYRGEDFYIETWKVFEDNDRRISIAYTQEDISLGRVNIVRNMMASENDCTLSRMISWSIPSEKFDEYVERFGLGD